MFIGDNLSHRTKWSRNVGTEILIQNVLQADTLESGVWNLFSLEFSLETLQMGTLKSDRLSENE